MPWIMIAQVVGGLVVLVFGAEILLRGAVRLASSFGISSLVIGLTVVAFGTSAPELAVSTIAAFEGQPDIAIGNVVGSNVCNILLILGLSAIVTPLVVKRQLIRIDVPVMIGVSLLMLLFALDLWIQRWEGIVLTIGIILYTAFLLRFSRKESVDVVDEFESEFGRTGRKRSVLNLVWVVSGIALLVLGSQWMVDGAVTLARILGVTELVIGLTVIAVGTSLPEIATSIVAAIRGERDIAVGNVIGSNIFNILCVLGVSTTVSPSGIRVSPAALTFDIPVMVSVAVLCLPIFFVRYEISRWNGWLFFLYYIAYTVFLIFDATQHDLLPHYSTIMSHIVFPVTLGTVLFTACRFYLKNRKSLVA